MPTFSDLWTNHPSSSISLEDEHNPANFPCTDKKGVVHPALENQCAIRVGLAFAGAGIKAESVAGERCWNGHGRKHILRVRNLVPWIDATIRAITSIWERRPSGRGLRIPLRKIRRSLVLGNVGHFDLDRFRIAKRATAPSRPFLLSRF